MLSSSSAVLHPGRQVASQLHLLIDRCNLLNDRVVFSLPVAWQYNTMRLEEWSFDPLATSTVSVTSNQLDHFQQVNDRDDDNLSFFDCFPSMSDLEENNVRLDYFDVLSLQPPSFEPFNWLHDDCVKVCHLTSVNDHDPAELSSDLPLPLSLMAAPVDLIQAVNLLPGTATKASFPVIFDSGASLAISPMKEDFVGPITTFTKPRFLGGMANGMPIVGMGTVQWCFKAVDKILVIHSKCYYVPDCKARLISPQRLFNKSKGVNGEFIVKELEAELTYFDVGTLHIPYDTNSHLPICLGRNLSSLQAESPQVNISILEEQNQNLTGAQKLLLLWHYRFGHKGFAVIQFLFRQALFISEAFKTASKCTIPKCEVCEYAKAHRQPLHSNTQKVNIERDGTLKDGFLRAGAGISVDYFESRLKGRTNSSMGRASSDKYVGGCIFVDHMSGYIHVEHQLGFSSSETIRAKQNFEKMALDHGVIIESYLADNGVFKANAFVGHIRAHDQKL